MIFEIEISAQADNDLRNIYEYIAYELQSPKNAKGQFDRLEKSILGLNQMPERFRAYKQEPWYSRGLRIMPVDNYCVLYIPNTEKAVVTVIRVMYGGRDIEAQLKKHLKSR
jgi:toxin ParE1/3/4